mgnify:CR=1 FL=1
MIVPPFRLDCSRFQLTALDDAAESSGQGKRVSFGEGADHVVTGLFGGMGGGTMFGFFFQAEDGIRVKLVTGVQTCALPIS